MDAKQQERDDAGNSVYGSPSVNKGPVGNLLVYHQLYCLVRVNPHQSATTTLAPSAAQMETDRHILQNLLRQHTYRLEYNYSGLISFSGTEKQVMEHANRCIETLRKTLMCSGDTTPYLIMLTPERPGGESPDFNTLHGCRKMDKITRWSEENALISNGSGMDRYIFTDSVY